MTAPLRLAVALALCLVACHTGAVQSPERFEDSWGAAVGPGNGVVRAWPGADWHATRQEDWQVRGTTVECRNSKAGTSGRTLALLTRTIQAPVLEPIRLKLRLETPGRVGAKWRNGAHAGLLFGVGGPGVKYQRSALVQQAPAVDGGLLLSVNHEGRLRISSFHDPMERPGYWTVPGKVDFDGLRVLAEADQRVDLDEGSILVSLIYEPHGDALQDRGRLSAIAWAGGSQQPTSPDRIASLYIDDFPGADLGGSLSLFSALGAEDSSLGFAFSDFHLTGATEHPERAMGPILATTYLVDRSAAAQGGSTLRLTAHLAALGDGDGRTAELWLEGHDGKWELAGTSTRTEDGSDLACFEVDGYRDLPDGTARPYRVELPGLARTSAAPLSAKGDVQGSTFGGLIRAEPQAKEDWVLASLSCLKNQVGPIAWNHSGLWFPHEQLVERVMAEDPDFLYFSGDQIYEGDITGPNRQDLDLSIEDYQTKYRRFLWAFRDLLRDRPSVMVPDDHDVFHGNLWGAGGIHAEARNGLTAQDSGGYRMPAKFVNVVHRSLTSNLPPTRVSPFIGKGITTYTTDFTWGGVDFAVLADRMWKDSPSVMAPGADFKNGWSQAEGFDLRASDFPDASLLGDEQEAFLKGWARTRQPTAWTKVALSQSPFACAHSLPADTKSDVTVGRQQPPLPGEYPANDAPVADGDSNGWPQAARNRAVEILAEAGALHLCGDQHLGTVSWYGTDAHRNGTVAFTSPAMGNTWPRRWMPSKPGANRPVTASGEPTTPRYTGDYLDGFGNRITMLAVANPEENGREPKLQMNRAPGFGLVRFQPSQARIVLEAWPTWDSDRMYLGWPIYINARGRPVGGAWE